ncbi:MAG: hypothetical protein GY696_19820 [Gammaproteobacteria bacterium]|nr:hypothetical protein [Gammaproteobacteria bacterium]
MSQEILTLPSIRTLQKLTKNLNVFSDPEDSYLKKRFTGLNDHEKYVNLMIDEIYVSERAEYAAPTGEITGLTSVGGLARTVLVFMISSLVGGYKDTVALYPVAGLKAEKLLLCFMEVLNRLCHVGYEIVTVSVDGLSTNRKLFKELGGGELKAEVQNPVTGRPLFLILDPVHNFKNIYNNFQRKRLFRYPAMPNFIHGNSADFQ